MRKAFGVMAAGLLLAIMIVSPARAQDVDQRIKALEDELTRLKTEQAQVKAEQIEMKRSALAAEGALPTFSYRPGSGLLIEAADKAWSIRFSLVAHMRMLFESGSSHAGRTVGEVMGRRWRPFFTYCINDCFWEMLYGIDADGFGTGNGKNATNTATGSILQRGAVYAHLEQIAPWLPTFAFGMDTEGGISSARQGSSSTGSQMDYDLLSRNNGFNTGSASQSIALTWTDVGTGWMGVPGRIREFQMVMGGIGEAGDGLSSFRDSGHNFSFHLEVEPFSQLKSKWLQGLSLEMGGWFCRVERNDAADNACDRLRIQDNGDGGRQTLFDTGSNIGAGWTHYLIPGVSWTVGPYRLRAIGGFQHYDGNDSTFLGKTVGRNFLIGHDLFLWSPKGWLTGSATTPGSILVGTHFERNDVDCNSGGGRNFAGVGCGVPLNQSFGSPATTVVGAPGFNRNTILVREWDIWYFVANRMSIGISWLWYKATNLPLSAQYNLGVRSKSRILSNPDNGKGGEWLDMNLNWRYVF